jgi:predicted transcriptional regulator
MNELIRDFMTAQPWTVQADDSLALARSMLLERAIHHLPVANAGEVVGMVTPRDLATATERDFTVSHIMRPTRCVRGDATLAEVVETMTREHHDAIVVTDHGQIRGIFTNADALRVLAGILRARAA